MKTKDMAGKVCMVTGANSGIGKATAQQLAERDARVVMVCRNRERGEPARDEIVKKSGNDEVTLLTADFASQRQIRTLADAFKRANDRIDVLVNNAGLYCARRTETEDGIETTWAVNHLAPFLLTNLLLDVIKASAPARIVTVSSNSHYGNAIDFDDPGMKEHYHWIKAYGQSKLANVLFTYELARRLAGDPVPRISPVLPRRREEGGRKAGGVTATCLHPGVVATHIWSRNRNPISLLVRPFKPFMMRPEQSARAVVRLAVAPELEGVTGSYFDVSKQRRSSSISYDEDVAGRLWDLSEEMTGLDAAGSRTGST